jgi:hypothetical protein
VLAPDGGASWKASAPFGIYGAEGEAVQLFAPTPERLMFNYRSGPPWGG